jgi:hypothetical protein
MTLPPSTEEVWTFARRDERLSLRRKRDALAGYVLIETQTGMMDRTYFFAELAALEQFQTDYHQTLIRAGWRLIEFSGTGFGS